MLDNFSVDRFFEALPYMGKGMLGIFIVIGVIIGVILLLNKLTTRKKSGK
ncbi:MAG: hypothetical protein IKL59_07810 [Clostridia bacterium]|nr:hypothetical protein [Clostridia bacterium]